MEHKRPDWRVYLDYYKRKARGENPQHVYDGYKGDQSEPEDPVGSNNNQMVAERARAELESQKGGKATAEPKKQTVKRKAADKKTPKRKRTKKVEEVTFPRPLVSCGPNHEHFLLFT